jgi:hypothetical protein
MIAWSSPPNWDDNRLASSMRATDVVFILLSSTSRRREISLFIVSHSWNDLFGLETVLWIDFPPGFIPEMLAEVHPLPV